MCKSSIGITLLLLTGILMAGCSKNDSPKQFIMSSDEGGVICSAKSTFNDTIFYENRFPDTTIYYYAKLSKQQNDELKQSIVNLKSENTIPEFQLSPGSGTFIVASDDVAFYEGNYTIPSTNVKKILTLFKDMAPAMKTCERVENFWNIEGVTAPENPIE